MLFSVTFVLDHHTYGSPPVTIMMNDECGMMNVVSLRSAFLIK